MNKQDIDLATRRLGYHPRIWTRRGNGQLIGARGIRGHVLSTLAERGSSFAELAETLGCSKNCVRLAINYYRKHGRNAGLGAA